MTCRPINGKDWNRRNDDSDEPSAPRPYAPAQKVLHCRRSGFDSDAGRTSDFTRSILPVVSLGVPVLAEPVDGFPALVDALSPGGRWLGICDSSSDGIR